MDASRPKLTSLGGYLVPLVVYADEPRTLTRPRRITFGHAAHGTPFDVGRVPGGLALRSRQSDRRSVERAGRAVLDAMRLVRASGRRLDDFTLDASGNRA